MSKYKKVMMKTAIIWSEESYCKKRKVGAVVERNGHILDIGYNGTIAGVDNNCETTMYECNYCKNREDSLEKLVQSLPTIGVRYTYGVEVPLKCKYCSKTIAILTDGGRGLEQQRSKDKYSVIPATNDFTIHAEQNIITNCAKEGISLKGATMYVTTSPCKTCAKLIAGSGISKVYYATEYKDLSGVKYLNDLGIKTELYEVERD